MRHKSVWWWGVEDKTTSLQSFQRPFASEQSTLQREESRTEVTVAMHALQRALPHPLPHPHGNNRAHLANSTKCTKELSDRTKVWPQHQHQLKKHLCQHCNPTPRAGKQEPTPLTSTTPTYCDTATPSRKHRGKGKSSSNHKPAYPQTVVGEKKSEVINAGTSR